MTTRLRPLPGAELLEARIAPAAANINLASLNDSKGFEISGAAEYDHSGVSVSGAGDFNGDGVDDLIVGADGVREYSGAAYVVFGQKGDVVDLKLQNLNGTNGFTINGEAPGNSFGYSVSGAGDFNGDGLDDLVIGAAGTDVNGTDSGTVYVIFGRANSAAVLDLTALEASAGLKIHGLAEGDQVGEVVSDAGDVNGDGLDDIIVSAGGVDPNGLYSGASYVIFGRSTADSATFDLSALDGSNGFRISGEAAGDSAGESVSSAGDINDDGFADVIVGASGASANGSKPGAAYVIFGQEAGFAADIALGSLDGIVGFKINGEADGHAFGTSVSGAGDVNGDGYADLIVGAPDYSSPDGDYVGASYILFGKETAFEAAVNTTTLTGVSGFKIVGEVAYDSAGSVVSGAGDVNGDGFDDVLIGASAASPHGDYSGASYVVFGKAGFSSELRLKTLHGDNGFQISGAHAGDYSGTSVSGIGDVNGDGADDVLIGAPAASPNGDYSGASYVIFGRAPRGEEPNNSVDVPEPDGDVVTIEVKGGDIGMVKIDLAADGSIEEIDLTGFAAALHAKGAGAKALSLTINVKNLTGGGDGQAKIGFINAAGLGLGSIKIEGSLGHISAGMGGGKMGIKSLNLSGDFGNANGASQLSRIVGGMSNLTVGGSMQNDSVQVDGGIKNVYIGGHLNGASGLTPDNLAEISAVGIDGFVARGNALPGGLLLAEAIAKMTIGGSIKGGGIVTTKDLGSMSMLNMNGGSIFSGGKVRSIKVRGEITAGENDDPASMTSRDGFDKITIKHDVNNALILAGYTKDGEPVNPDATIGKVVVKGNWIQSSLVAGVDDSTGDGFGRNDTVIAGDVTPSITSRIASVVIKGSATGSSSISDDHFGIVAQQVGKLSIGGSRIDLSGLNSEGILLDQANGDFRVVAVA
jgi:hypothetical protein